MGIKSKPGRFALSMLDALDQTAVNRVKNGMDKKTISHTRITDALAKDFRLQVILKDIERRPPKKR
jgi:hypothetical protein